MAVNLSAADLANAIRVDSDNTAQFSQVERLLAYSKIAINDYAPSAPSDIQNESAIRLSGYLFDQPFSSGGTGYQNALRNSGAAAILERYRSIGASVVANGVAATVSGGGGSGGGAGLPTIPSDDRSYILSVTNGVLTWLPFPTP